MYALTEEEAAQLKELIENWVVDILVNIEYIDDIMIAR